MEVLNILECIFNSIFSIYVIISFIISGKNLFLNTSESDRNNTVAENTYNELKWKEKVETIIKLVTAIVAVVIIIWIVVKMKNWYWMIIIIGIPKYLEGVVAAYQSIEIISGVVKSKDKGKLSSNELASITVVSSVIYFFKIQNIFAKIIEKVELYTETYRSDILIILLYFFAFSIYIFLICSLTSEMTITIIGVIKKICERWPWTNEIKKVEDSCISKIGKTVSVKSFLIFQWEHIGRWNGYVKWIRYLLLPFAFVIDIIFLIIRVLIYTVIWYSIGYICILIRLIKKTLDKLSNWILDLSDKRIVAISFRIALIMALVCIVVMNRYQPIFKEQEASTAVLEFVASAIIIPVIFEWINSAKNNHQEER